MPMPQYARKTDAPISITVKIEHFVEYLFQITNNEKQFPKAYRYTLVSDIRNTALSLYKNVNKALAIRPRYRKEYNRRAKFQNKAYNDFIDLKSLIFIALDVLHLRNPEYIAHEFSVIAEGFEKWIKNDKRVYSRLPSKKEYIAYRQQQQAIRKAKRVETYKQWRELDTYRDDTGFVLLKQRSTHD